MKLLICTQAVDENDPALGFFVRWVEEFSKRFEFVIVICLKKGTYTLPENVQVISLGKEEGVGRMAYIRRFLHTIWCERGCYDAVFVHMNQEYVLLGSALWFLLNKRLFLWRNHYAGSLLTQIAGKLAARVFYTSASSYTARFSIATCMPVGVDAARFQIEGSEARVPASILFLGRIAPSKHPDTVVETCATLRSEGRACTVTICGPVAEKDEEYAQALRARVRQLGLGAAVTIAGPVTHALAPSLYRAHDIFVDLSRSGMYNKTLFEAALCGCRIIATSADFAAHNDPRYALKDASVETLAAALRGAIAMPAEEARLTAQKTRSYALHHTLDALADKIAEELQRHLV